jgi:hypothetical protein
MKRALALGVVFVLAVVSGALALALRDEEPERAAVAVAADPHGAEIETMRTLLVGREAPPASRPGPLLRGRLVDGAMPHAALDGTVLSDEDCAADAMGISNCLNRIRLEDGRAIAVRHPHDMREVPCLAPGEPVRVVPA